MLDRVRGQHGLEANYRRMFLLVRALEDYFLLRNTWFRGEKEALAWLIYGAGLDGIRARACRRCLAGGMGIHAELLGLVGSATAWNRSCSSTCRSTPRMTENLRRLAAAGVQAAAARGAPGRRRRADRSGVAATGR